MSSRRSRKRGKGKPAHPRPNYLKQARAQARRAQRGPESATPTECEPEPRGPSPVVSLDPLAPIIVRTGRPFDGRSDADPARFPPPSTMAGCLRTAWARATGRPFGLELAQLSVAGPLLITQANRILVPKPADALYFGHGTEARCVRTEPREFAHGCGADLPGGLLPVQLTEHVDGKPGGGPAWWSWEDLLAFRDGTPVTHGQLCASGWSPPPGDRRTHVAIDPDTGTAAAGRLFQTEGLDLDARAPVGRGGASAGSLRNTQAQSSGVCAGGFRDASASPGRASVGTPRDTSAPPGGASAGGFRLLVRCGEALGATLVHLGGKRRLAALQPEPESVWPAPPEGWLDKIAWAGGLCLTLLTPGIFSAGYRPGWLDADLTGSPPTAPALRLQLRAAAVDRWQPHSGWDLARRQPRPTRKLAGAGAVYWFRILGHANPDALGALWLASLSDLEQDRRDGFGLALPSPWTPPVRG